MSYYRYFSDTVKFKEGYNAAFRCRICGSYRFLKYLPIYPRKVSPSHQRRGIKPSLWTDGGYIRSLDNCLCVCLYHYRKLRTKKGYKKYSIDYLTSLKTNYQQCTKWVLINGEAKRCNQPTGRIYDESCHNMLGEYKCPFHYHKIKELEDRNIYYYNQDRGLDKASEESVSSETEEITYI